MNALLTFRRHRRAGAASLLTYLAHAALWAAVGRLVRHLPFGLVASAVLAVVLVAGFTLWRAAVRRGIPRNGFNP